MGAVISQGNKIARRSLAENINSVPQLKAISEGATQAISQGQTELSDLGKKIDSGKSQATEAIGKVKANVDKERAQNAIATAKARENAQKASKAQRIKQQYQAQQELTARMAKI